MQKTQQFDVLGHQGNSSKFSLEARMLADQAAKEELLETQNQESKKQVYQKIAKQLELENIPKEKISIYTIQIIEERLLLQLKKENIPKDKCKMSPGSIRYLRRIMQELGYTDPFYARNTKEDTITKPLVGYNKENQNTITLVKKLKEFSKIFISYLESNSFELKIDPDFLNEFMSIMNARMDASLEALNNKQKIETHEQFLLFEAYAIRGADVSASIYREKIKNYSSLTGKQVKKLFAGTTTKLIELYNPKNTYEAIKNGFSGIVCDHCQSLRTIFTGNPHVVCNVFVGNVPKVWCCACHKLTKPVLKLLPNTNRKSQ